MKHLRYARNWDATEKIINGFRGLRECPLMCPLRERSQLGEGSDEGGLSLPGLTACATLERGSGFSHSLTSLQTLQTSILLAQGHQNRTAEKNIREVTLKPWNTHLAQTDLGLCRNHLGQQHRLR